MRRTTLTFISAVVLTASAVSACGGSHARSSARSPSTVDSPTGSSPRTTLRASPTTERTTTTTPATTATPTTTVAPPTTPPSTTVPTTITPAYVNAVLAALNHVYGDATRIMIATTDLPPSAVADIRSIFADQLLNTELKIFSLELDQGFADVQHPPGDRVTKVLKIFSSSPTCIYAQTATTFNNVLYSPPIATGSEYTGIETKLTVNDPQGLNPTGWSIFFNESSQTPTGPPANPCAG